MSALEGFRDRECWRRHVCVATSNSPELVQVVLYDGRVIVVRPAYFNMDCAET